MNHQIFERILHSWDSPGSTFRWVSVLTKIHSVFIDCRWENECRSVLLQCVALKPLLEVDSIVSLQYSLRLLSLFMVNVLECCWWQNVNWSIISMSIPSYQNVSKHSLGNRSQLKREDPLNLSILLRGGKENNNDSLSNGEWSGKSSSLKPIVLTGNRVVA